ncbi:MAG: tetratricopeptide repeat protein [Planctomycetes bacterium]|nr:tetratricopeptide repeat protein [Planctomycetota bacterium]MBI3835334.1 tetratricopeptide repeat protein [Planctomycetota bacterium]
MSYLLEILGRGLLSELGSAFRGFLADDDSISTRELEQVAAEDSANPENQRRLGIRALRDRQYVRACHAFERILKTDAFDHVARIGLACALDDLGQPRKAIEHLNTVQTHDPNDAATLFAIGFLHEKLGGLDEAVTAYEAALEVSPELRNAHERLAAIHLRRRDIEGAIAHYEHVCWCDPGDITAAISLANLYLRAGRHDDAVRRFEEAIILDPDNWEAKDDLVSASTDAGQYQKALETLQGMIEECPECADQYRRLGDLLIKMSRPDDALEAYSQAVDLNPDHLEATIKLGTSHLRTGAFTRAAGAFSRAIELNDRIVAAYVGLGVAQLALDRTEDAKSSLEMAGGAEPNSMLLYRELARLQLKVSAAQQVERYSSPQAITDHPGGPLSGGIDTILRHQIGKLRQALEIHPNHADLHYRLGVLLKSAGDVRAAIESFGRAIQINPRYLKALVRLSLSLHEVGELDAAIKVAKEVLALDDESTELHYQLGLMFADRNQFALALDRFDHAARKMPTNMDYVANLALALQNMGLLDRAVETWRTLCDLETTQVTKQTATRAPSRFPATTPPCPDCNEG